MLDNTGPAAEDAVVVMSEVSKSYGSNVVLDQLDFRVAPGEKVCIIGPSGSGKTTVLRVLAGLVRPESGMVTVCGSNLWQEERNGRLEPAREAHIRNATRDVGMVFQHFNLFPHMSARKNVAEPLRMVKNLSGSEAYDQADALLASVGLADQREKYPSQLSGGQQQRVAIARALALKPDIMLYDEVTSALDPELVGELLKVIEEISRTTSMAMILVTHEISFASHFADRVVMFDNGKSVEEGPPSEILTKPSNERTQRFLHRLLDRG